MKKLDFLKEVIVIMAAGLLVLIYILPNDQYVWFQIISGTILSFAFGTVPIIFWGVMLPYWIAQSGLYGRYIFCVLVIGLASWIWFWLLDSFTFADGWVKWIEIVGQLYMLGQFIVWWTLTTIVNGCMYYWGKSDT